MAGFDLEDIKRRMDGAIAVLRQEFAGLRTGRASTSLLEPISVNAYGSNMPLNQVASVSAPEPRLLTVQVWDKSLVKATETAVRDSGLGLNPIVDGQLLRVPIPELTEDRRKELVKIAHKYSEDARIAVRNVRRDGVNILKRLEKDSEISKDEHHEKGVELQKLTDGLIGSIGEVLAAKEKDIMQV